MWLLVMIPLSLFLDIQTVSTKSLTPFKSEGFFDVMSKNHAFESLSSRDTVIEAICELPHRDDYVYSSGFGAHKLHTDSRSWNEARKICKEENAQLAIINSKAEQDILQNTLQRAANASGIQFRFGYVGAHKLFGSGDWVIVSGESLYAAGYENWSIGQPENEKGEHCAALRVDDGLDDFNCTTKLPFFCELLLSCRIKQA